MKFNNGKVSHSRSLASLPSLDPDANMGLEDHINIIGPIANGESIHPRNRLRNQLNNILLFLGRYAVKNDRLFIVDLPHDLNSKAFLLSSQKSQKITGNYQIFILIV